MEKMKLLVNRASIGISYDSVTLNYLDTVLESLQRLSYNWPILIANVGLVSLQPQKPVEYNGR
jgi:hypothetical protein